MKKNKEAWAKRGQTIKKTRENKKLLQKDLAQILKVQVSTISDYENGIKRMDFDTIKTLCKFLDIDIRTL